MAKGKKRQPTPEEPPLAAVPQALAPPLPPKPVAVVRPWPGGALSLESRRSRIVAMLLLAFLALLPSLLVLTGPFYEEDVIGVVGAKASPQNAGYTMQGRLFFAWTEAYLYRAMHYPAAFWVMGLINLTVNTAIFALLWMVFSYIVRSRVLAAFTAAAIFLHFHFAEFRFYNGHFSGMSILFQLLGISAAIRLGTRGGWKNNAAAVALPALGCLLAFNCHQAGALTGAGFVGLLFTAVLLRGFRTDRARTRVMWLIAGGLLLGVALYGLELLIISRTVGITGRAANKLDRNALGWQLWDQLRSYLFAPNAYQFNHHPFRMQILFWLVLAAAVLLPSRFPIGRRLLVPLFLLPTVYVTGLGPVLGDGFFSSRTQLGVVVIGFGFIALLVGGMRWRRRIPAPALVGGLAILALFYLHLGPVRYSLKVRRTDNQIVAHIEKKLNEFGVKSGDTIHCLTVLYPSPCFAYGDFGRSFLTTEWGYKAYIKQIPFAEPRIPTGLTPSYKRGPTPVMPPVVEMVKRLGPNDFLLDLNFITVSQLEIEDSLMRPWASNPRYNAIDLFNASPGTNPIGKYTTHYRANGKPSYLVLRAPVTGQESIVLAAALPVRKLLAGRLTFRAADQPGETYVAFGYYQGERFTPLAESRVTTQTPVVDLIIPARDLPPDAIIGMGMKILKRPADPKRNDSNLLVDGFLEVDRGKMIWEP